MRKGYAHGLGIFVGGCSEGVHCIHDHVVKEKKIVQGEKRKKVCCFVGSTFSDTGSGSSISKHSGRSGFSKKDQLFDESSSTCSQNVTSFYICDCVSK
jgi:hypothetical protein